MWVGVGRGRGERSEIVRQNVVQNERDLLLRCKLTVGMMLVCEFTDFFLEVK